MRKIKDVLRLRLDAKLSHQQIAAALGISKGVLTKYAGLAAAAGLDWPAVQDVDKTVLEHQLIVMPERPSDHAQPDYARLHQELRTLMLLWEEYRADHATLQTYAYSRLCQLPVLCQTAEAIHVPDPARRREALQATRMPVLPRGKRWRTGSLRRHGTELLRRCTAVDRSR